MTAKSVVLLLVVVAVAVGGMTVGSGGLVGVGGTAVAVFVGSCSGSEARVVLVGTAVTSGGAASVADSAVGTAKVGTGVGSASAPQATNNNATINQNNRFVFCLKSIANSSAQLSIHFKIIEQEQTWMHPDKRKNQGKLVFTTVQFNKQPALNIKFDVNDIAILHDVGFAFLAQLACVARLRQTT
jgi:hypothetical protein